MKNSLTTEDLRRVSFVDNLYKQLRQQTKSALEDHDRLMVKANLYLEDGLSESECSELLIIDGISRESAESYVQLAKSNAPLSDGKYEYSFNFEDTYGKVWSSYDVNHAIYASNDEDAWERAEGFMVLNESVEAERIVSVNRVS